MSTWNLKELREKTAIVLSEDDRQSLSDFLDSFHWKSQAAHHHLLQADECFKDYLDIDEMQATQKLLQGHKGLRFAAKIREISLVSSVMIVNTLPEVLAQVINLLFLKKRFSVNNVYLCNVIKEMSLGHIKDRLEAIVASEDYIYTSAFTNTVKHVNLVKSGYRVSFENGLHGVQFKAFKYRERSFSEMIDRDLIEMVQRLRQECLGVGVVINAEWRH